ncbi:hypothetical protein LXL04_011817 [Taraxacum kok-saghyz]
MRSSQSNPAFHFVARSMLSNEKGEPRAHGTVCTTVARGHIIPMMLPLSCAFTCQNFLFPPLELWKNAQSPRDGRGPQSNAESAQGCCRLSAWILQVVSEPRSRVRFSQGAISEGGIVGAEMLSPRVMAEGRSRMPKALKVAAG